MERLVIESVNYDYIPGEPESRRVWFLTLREPPYDIKPGMTIRVNSYHAMNLPIYTNELYYRVRDIYGRNIVVDPIQVTPNNNKANVIPAKLPKINTINVSSSKNASEVLNNLNYGYARAGFYTYAQRPQTQNVPLSLFDMY